MFAVGFQSSTAVVASDHQLLNRKAVCRFVGNIGKVVSRFAFSPNLSGNKAKSRDKIFANFCSEIFFACFQNIVSGGRKIWRRRRQFRFRAAKADVIRLCRILSRRREVSVLFRRIRLNKYSVDSDDSENNTRRPEKRSVRAPQTPNESQSTDFRFGGVGRAFFPGAKSFRSSLIRRFPRFSFFFRSVEHRNVNSACSGSIPSHCFDLNRIRSLPGQSENIGDKLQSFSSSFPGIFFFFLSAPRRQVRGQSVEKSVAEIPRFRIAVGRIIGERFSRISSTSGGTSSLKLVGIKRQAISLRLETKRSGRSVKRQAIGQHLIGNHGK